MSKREERAKMTLSSVACQSESSDDLMVNVIEPHLNDLPFKFFFPGNRRHCYSLGIAQ